MQNTTITKKTNSLLERKKKEKRPSLAELTKIHKPLKEETKPPFIMGLVDATGSMSPVWSETRDIITELIHKVSRLGKVSMNWVAYRDYDLGEKLLLEKSGWQDKSEPLLHFMNKIQCLANSTEREAVERALEFAADDDKCTAVILIGDAPPHTDRGFRKQARRLAEQNKSVYSFVIGGWREAEVAFKEISQITGGESQKLDNAEDILAYISITIAHTSEKEDAVSEILKTFDSLPPGAQDFVKRLSSPKR